MSLSERRVLEDAEVVRERLAHAALHGVWVVEAIAALDRLVTAAVGADEQTTSGTPLRGRNV